MTFLDYANLFGLAAAVTSLVPTLKPGLTSKWRAASIASGVFVLFVIIGNVWNHLEQEASIERTEERICGMLADNTPSTFEDIFRQLDRVDRNIANQAINRAVDRRLIVQAVVILKDSTGHDHAVRLYNFNAFGIPGPR